MRLLRCSDAGDFRSPRAFASDETIPPYAILSHTWEDGQEITFQDLKDGTGKGKTGYDKIRFCAQQAKRDGLEYFWVDTCCIDKSDRIELQTAINSMFRWYKNAERCYVYLSDISTAKQKGINVFDFLWKLVFWIGIWFIWGWPLKEVLTPEGEASEEALLSAREPDIRQSRWFRRGWTLQELLAPLSVEFFSREWGELGDKQSLGQQIHEATGIPCTALHGAPLSQFSDKQRFTWIQSRETKVEEDKAYALLGIFSVELPLRYGEGFVSAFKRLEEEIDKLNICLQDLRSTDPRDDKKRIEDTKGGLLIDSYCWILNNHDFQQWRDNSQSRLLWVKGDPGKGKTMLLCGIINEMNKSAAMTTHLCYFFCQATDSRINSATAVLRGLLFMLIRQQPSLILHVQKKHGHTGKALFEDANAWVALSEIFTSTVQDPSLTTTYLVIDALDECITDLSKLLDLIVQTSSTSSRVKWIMSSRNWPDIEERLERAEDKIRLSLELNAESVSAAVHSYIKHKVARLAQDRKYNDQTKQAVLEYLYANANDTFLWAALVCQNLNQMSRFNVVAKLDAFPPGLNSLYDRMIQRINNSDDADLCRRVLATVAIVYRPVTLQELTSLVEELDGMAEESGLVQEVISLCGSLLTVRNGIIYFVHQSAKDFLLEEAFNVIFPSGSRVVHYAVFSRLILVISNTLQRDIYGLSALGCSIEQVQQPEPDPLAASRYSCIYWIDHLFDSDPDSSASYATSLQDEGAVHEFIRKKYLYWLEALSLCKSMSKGVISVAKLETLVHGEGDASALIKLVQDARRFIMSYKWVIENSPLQVYVSALVFSPARSLIRSLFMEDAPDWVTVKPAVRDKWSACLSTLEGHSDMVTSVAFSPDAARLASASDDGTVKIWDTSSGECLQTLSVGRVLYKVSFDITGQYLHTDVGIIKTDTSQLISPPTATKSTINPQIPRYKGVSISLDKAWITFNSENLLWLPSEYRPSCSAVSGTRICIGTGSGRVWICKLNLDTSKT